MLDSADTTWYPLPTTRIHQEIQLKKRIFLRQHAWIDMQKGPLRSIDESFQTFFDDDDDDDDIQDFQARVLN